VLSQGRHLKAVDNVNSGQRLRVANKVLAHFGENLHGKTFAVWGLSFKPRTDDMREAPSIYTINKLLERGAKIRGYDPVAIENAKTIFGDAINYATSSYDALDGADALLIITEWQEFRDPDFSEIKKRLKQPLIFDGRNLYEPEQVRALGFEYHSIGRP
jgi:UDPglucose 6-dehydrogenase